MNQVRESEGPIFPSSPTKSREKIIKSKIIKKKQHFVDPRGQE